MSMPAKGFVLMALISAGLSFGQAVGSGVVSGVVIDTASGDPVRKAIVTITWQGTPRSWATTRTDSDGAFRFERLPAGKYDLRAMKAGIGNAAYGADSARDIGELITLADGETRSGLKLRFLHFGSISGRVVDSDGDPLPRVTVQLLRQGRNHGAPVLVNQQGAMTDDRGDYRISGINPGEYFSRALPQPGMGQVRFSGEAPRTILLGAFFGDTRQEKDARPIRIRGGEILTGMDFHLTSTEIAKIHGHVSGVPRAEVSPTSRNPRLMSKPGEFVNVRITSLDAFGQQQTFGVGASVNDPQFNLDQMPPGRYRLQASMNGGGQQLVGAQVVDLQPGENQVELAVAPALEIKGQVRLEGPDAQLGSVRVALIPAGVRGPNITASPDATGHFTFRQVLPGEWDVDMVGNAPRGTYIRSVRWGDKDVLFTPFEITASDAQLTVVLSTVTAKIEGEVDAGGADPSRAGIVLAPVGKTHDFTRFYYGTPSDDHGKFKISDIAPGKYKIFAIEKMAAANFRNPEAADRLEPLGQEIELVEGKTLEVHPKLIPRERANEVLP